MGLMSLAGKDADPVAAFELVHANILRFFPDLAMELRGDPNALLRHAGIDPPDLSDGKISAGYRQIVDLLEHAAAELRCPDFGMRLATRQGGGKMFGPLGMVMKNSNTLGDALEYVEKHSFAHSLAARVRLERHRDDRTAVVSHDILLDRLPHKCQVVEQLLLLAHLSAIEITGGRARVRKVLFRHQPLSPLSIYRRYFGCEVCFDQQQNGVVFSERDLLCPTVDPDMQIYKTTTSFIDKTFAHARPPAHAQVRGVILQLMGTEHCSNEEVAAELHLHPRTLHRRLRAEGTSFQQIRDEVRRDLALHYLQQTDVDLMHIVEKLGYAEHAVLTRSCIRWFSVSPSQLRSQAARSQRNRISNQRAKL